MRDILLAAALFWCLWNSYDLHFNFKKDKVAGLVDKMTLKILQIHTSRLNFIDAFLGLDSEKGEILDKATSKSDYDKALEDAGELLLYADPKFLNTFEEVKESDYTLDDLIAKYGFKYLITKFNEWEKEKNKVEGDKK